MAATAMVVAPAVRAADATPSEAVHEALAEQAPAIDVPADLPEGQTGAQVEKENGQAGAQVEKENGQAGAQGEQENGQAGAQVEGQLGDLSGHGEVGDQAGAAGPLGEDHPGAGQHGGRGGQSGDNGDGSH